MIVENDNLERQNEVMMTMNINKSANHDEKWRNDDK